MLDELPTLIPVTARELDTIQIYLGDLIDRLIADAVCPAGTKSVSSPKAGKPAGVPPLERD